MPDYHPGKGCVIGLTMKMPRNGIVNPNFVGVDIGCGILAVIIPLAYPFLKLLKMPDDLIGTGTAYFSFDVISIIFQFINTIYFATLKSRGNTKQVMYGNQNWTQRFHQYFGTARTF